MIITVREGASASLRKFSLSRPANEGARWILARTRKLTPPVSESAAVTVTE